jgi:hypothetical protein
LGGSKVRVARELASWSVGGAVLDGGMAVPEVAKVVDVAGRKEGAGGEGVDGRVAPLRDCQSFTLSPCQRVEVGLPAPSKIHHSDPSC